MPARKRTTVDVELARTGWRLSDGEPWQLTEEVLRAISKGLNRKIWELGGPMEFNDAWLFKTWVEHEHDDVYAMYGQVKGLTEGKLVCDIAEMFQVSMKENPEDDPGSEPEPSQ